LLPGMLSLLTGAWWSLSSRRWVLAHDSHGWDGLAAAISTRTGRAIAQGRLAGPDLLVPILVGRIDFTLFLFVREFGNVWFGHRQGHMLARRDHIEFPWKQHHEPTGMANATGNSGGVIAGTQIQIGARRSDDRRSCILRNHQAT